MIAALLLLLVARAQASPPARILDPRLELHDHPYALSSYWDHQQIGRHVLLTFSESAMNADLNLDGDTQDAVSHVVDLGTGAAIRPRVEGVHVDGVSGLVFDPALPGRGMGFVGSTYCALDLATGEATSSGVASAVGLAVSGTWGGLLVRDADPGQRHHLFSWDFAGPGGAVDTGIRAHRFSPLLTHSGYFLFQADELLDHQDWNGDGDRNDTVLKSYEPSTAALQNTGLAVLQVWARDIHSVMNVSESAQREDLNGDGDLVDTVLHVFNVETGELRNLQLAYHKPLSPVYDHPATDVDITDHAVAFHVSEVKQGGADLNGDGDAIDEDVLFLHLFASGQTRSLLRSVWHFELEDGVLAMQVDGTTSIHDVARNSTWDLGLPLPPWFTVFGPKRSFAVNGPWVALAAYEDDVDHTGNGIGDDSYLVLADVRRRRIFDTGQGFFPYSTESDVKEIFKFHESGVLTVRVSEESAGRDLDGDGASDGEAISLVLPGPEEVIETGAGVNTLIVGFRNTYPFIATESGQDLNGDGDAADHVLRTIRLKLR